MSTKNILAIIFYGILGLMSLLTLITALSMWHKGLPIPPGLLFTGFLLTMTFVGVRILMSPKEDEWKKNL